MLKRSIVACLLALCLLTATACNGGSSSPATSSAPETTASTPAQEDSPTDGDAQEDEAQSTGDVIPLSVFKEGSRPVNDQTDMILQWARENLQVDIQLTQVSENFNQQLALLITSGDIPDVTLMPYDTYLEYAEQGAFTDITNLVGNYEDLMSYVGNYWDYLKVEGSIYGVPSMLSVPTSHVTDIRKDWLDNLGLEIPVTLDDYTEVMRAFTHNDPDGNGQADTYGFSCYGYDYLGVFFGAFGATSSQHYFMNDDGTITTNVISDNYRSGLEYLRDVYAEGLIDPEIFTATYEQAQQKWGRGEMGIWTSWWSGAGNAVNRFGFADLQPDAEVEIIYPPIGPDGHQGSMYAQTFDSVVAIARDIPQEKVDAALRLLNCQTTQYGFYVFQYGIEDVGFELDETGTIAWNYSMGGLDRLGNEVTDMETYKLLFNEEIQRFSHSLSDDLVNRLYWRATEIQYSTPSIENVFAFTKTEEYITNNSELERYFTENSIRFIMGDMDLGTQWDQYKQGYLDMGGELVRQSLLESYNAKMGTSYTFAE